MQSRLEIPNLFQVEHEMCIKLEWRFTITETFGDSFKKVKVEYTLNFYLKLYCSKLYWIIICIASKQESYYCVP